jgi:hypothetical protein
MPAAQVVYPPEVREGGISQLPIFPALPLRYSRQIEANLQPRQGLSMLSKPKGPE